MPKGKNKKVIWLIKDELGGKIIYKICWIKTKNIYLGDSSKDKKAKGTKKRAINRKLKFKNYKNNLEATQFQNKINHLGKNQIDIDSIKKIAKIS